MTALLVYRKPCKLCEKPLIWGATRAGAKVPLDSVAPCYRIAPPDFAQAAISGFPPSTVLAELATKIPQPTQDPLAAPYAEIMVSHFATCPNAGEFSKAKSKAAERSVELLAIVEAFYQAIGNGDAMRDASIRYQRWKGGA
jgi:hypothetical protein